MADGIKSLIIIGLNINLQEDDYKNLAEQEEEDPFADEDSLDDIDLEDNLFHKDTHSYSHNKNIQSLPKLLSKELSSKRMS